MTRNNTGFGRKDYEILHVIPEHYVDEASV
jgi:hypothetical protein